MITVITKRGFQVTYLGQIDMVSDDIFIRVKAESIQQHEDDLYITSVLVLDVWELKDIKEIKHDYNPPT